MFVSPFEAKWRREGLHLTGGRQVAAFLDGISNIEVDSWSVLHPQSDHGLEGLGTDVAGDMAEDGPLPV